jgi:histidyl-tRNA synthetase
MEILFTILRCMNGLKNVIFDLSLARGLDYYTGLI